MLVKEETEEEDNEFDKLERYENNKVISIPTEKSDDNNNDMNVENDDDIIEKCDDEEFDGGGVFNTNSHEISVVMPPNYTFFGWAAFFLWGSLVPRDKQIGNFSVGEKLCYVLL